MPKQQGLHTTNSTSIDPSSYRMQVTLYSATGKERDITALVTSYVVTESIFQQTLMAEIDLNDGVSMMEDLNITGNEKITVVIRRQNSKTQSPITLQHDWHILDMPLYSRIKPDLQVYKFRCVSNFGLISKFKRVEHAQIGTPTEIIASLYKEIGVTAELKDSQGLGVIKWIPPRLTYSAAIATVLNRAVANSGAPFFAYQTFSEPNKHVIASYDSMVGSKEYDRYSQGFFYGNEAQTDADYEEKRRRILEVSSNLGFSAYKGLKDGAYVTRTHALDISNKTYTQIDYNAFDTPPPMIDGSKSELAWNKTFNVSGVSPANLKDTFNIYVATNELAMSDSGHLNFYNHMPYISARKNSVYKNLDQISHSVRLHGDTELSSGKIVELAFPKSGEETPGAGREVDKLLSGRYLVVSTTHTFNGDGYYTTIKAKRDSVHIRSQ